MKKIKFKSGTQFRAYAPLRVDFVGMSDFFPTFGRNINACLAGLNAELYATFRSDDLVRVDAGAFGIAEMKLDEIYKREFAKEDPMFFKALRMYPDFKLENGVNIHIDCQYGAGGLSTSSSVAGAIHAFLEKIFSEPSDPLKTVWKVIKTEPHSYGRQDQLSVVFGGINMWEMEPEEFDIKSMTPITFQSRNIRRYALTLCEGSLKSLEESILIYESGINENASTILSGVANEYQNSPKSLEKKFNSLNKLASEMWQTLNQHWSTSAELAEALGPTLNRVRESHSALHPDAMNNRMSDLFEAAFKAGAIGGRINGAGKRGTIQIATPSHLRARVEAALDQVDTPGPGANKKIRGHLIRYGGFDMLGARCWASKF